MASPDPPAVAPGAEDGLLSAAASQPHAVTPAEPTLSPTELLALPAHALTLARVTAAVPALPPHAQPVVCANLVLAGTIIDARVLRRVVELGLGAAGGAEEIALLEGDVRARLEEVQRPPAAPRDSADGETWQGWPAAAVAAQVDDIVKSDPQRAVLVSSLAVLHDARRRLDTYDAFYPPRQQRDASPAPSPDKQEPGEKKQEDIEVDLDDDPWADTGSDDDDGGGDVPAILDDPWGLEDDEDETSAPAPAAEPVASPPGSDEDDDDAPPPIDPSTFVLESLVLSALYFATGTHLKALRITAQRHAAELWPYRVALLQAVPGWMGPGEDDVLPLLLADDGEGGEGPWPRGRVAPEPPTLLDFVPRVHGTAGLRPYESGTHLLPTPRTTPLASTGLTQWYSDHVLALDDLGLLDAQLAWVQHATALGVTRLDELGEELSLLSRLIYDANLSPDQLTQWSLSKWRDASEEEIVGAYLANSTPESVVTDLNRLVMPYLYVLEARAERSGNADPDLVSRMLHGAILDLPLRLALPCFEASKATLPTSSRLVKDDQTVARLALAVLYGSDLQDAWSTMSSIFECLPVWDVSGGDADTDREATETTLESIADFVRPTASSAGTHRPRDLFMFFKPLPFASLSRALDILDVHLESGELLARHGVRVVLRTLLQSARARDEQVTLAEQMVRRAPPGDERHWMALWEDMCRLQGGADALLRGAFGMLTKEEVMRTFLGGLVASANFAVAKKVIRRLEPEGYFTPQDLENVVLTTSNEFYMRAETGNIHTGDMKLAYECLSVAPATDAIRAEQDFIQATSRIASFRALQLASLTPAEIRHTPDKLDLVRRVLETSDDAYRHPPLILELADKLGLRGNPAARAQVLAMMCDAAVAAEDWGRARARVDEMVVLAEPDTGPSTGDNPTEEQQAATVRNVTYRACLALGRQTEYPDVVDRTALLARAVAFAPAADVPAILPLWSAAQALCTPDTIRAHARAQTAAAAGATAPAQPAGAGEERMLGSRTAARAAKWGLDNLRSFTASPASSARAGSGSGSGSASAMARVGSRGASPVGSRAASASGARGPGPARTSRDLSRPMSRGDSRGSLGSRDSRGSFGSATGAPAATDSLGTGAGRDARDAAALFDDDGYDPADKVRAGARRALVKGVGWLLGAEEGEIGH